MRALHIERNLVIEIPVNFPSAVNGHAPRQNPHAFSLLRKSITEGFLGAINPVILPITKGAVFFMRLYAEKTIARQPVLGGIGVTPVQFPPVEHMTELQTISLAETDDIPPQRAVPVRGPGPTVNGSEGNIIAQIIFRIPL